ncbi:MAG: hypothetical protein RLZZ28_312 [Bacteroidota bacterium]
MATYKNNIIYLFLLILFLHCAFIYAGNDLGRTITKLLLLPVLILFLYAAGSQSDSVSSKKWVFAALVFSFLGDLFLTRSGEIFFLIGMLAFIGTHVCNGIQLLKLNSLKSTQALPALVALVLLGLIAAFVLSVLNPYLGSLKLPIFFYLLIISSMAVLAANTYANKDIQYHAIAYFIPGAALFVVSDGLLAMNKFYFHLPMLDIAVMLTYGCSQMLLVLGFSRTKA